MEQLNKNRLIGGSVLLFAALLFAPSILIPKDDSSTLTVQVESNRIPVEVAFSTDVSTQPVGDIENPAKSPADKPDISNINLASVQTPVQPKKKLPPGMVAPPQAKQAQTPVAASRVQGVWLRVGSFASKKNASTVLKKLQTRYPVRLEVTSLNGKRYHRVLVGPFTDKQKLQSAQQTFTNLGYNPSIQR